jgi:hypothetical protein
VSEQNKPLTDRKPLEREPVFGEWLRGIYASERNPRRDGMYVETIRRTGRMNPGKAYRCTDGKGDFWEYPHDSVIFLAATRAPQEAAAEVEYAKSLAVSLWRNHYKETAPNWEPFDDLMGLLSQIDNMTCRLVLPAGPQEAAAAEGEARKIWESLPSGKSAKDVIQAFARALSQAATKALATVKTEIEADREKLRANGMGYKSDGAGYTRSIMLIDEARRALSPQTQNKE